MSIIACLMINMAYTKQITIIAAENFYGEVAKNIGGHDVNVKSIISGPNVDPHTFTTSVSTSKILSQAQIIIYNGADYDPWMAKILPLIDRKVTVINVAKLMNINSGSNPHIWYDPKTFILLAETLTKEIVKINPQLKKSVDHNLKKFINDYQNVLNKIAEIKKQYNGVSVIATEPVFGYMAEAMGLKMQGLDVQWKIMNGTEPTPKMLANYYDLITKGQVQILFYNSQVTNSTINNILNLAKKNNVPIVGVTETLPLNISIKQWLLETINATHAALALEKKLSKEKK